MKVTSNLFFYTNETLWGCGESLVHCNFLLILWGSSWLLLILFHSSRWRRKNFPLTPPNTLLFLSGFARQMRSTTEFAMTVLSKCVCVCVCVWDFHVANHASPWFNRGGPGAWLRHDLGPGQLPGSLPTCHCQVQHQVGHACQARGGQCWEEDGESNVMDGSEKVDRLERIFLPWHSSNTSHWTRHCARLWLYCHTRRVLTHTEGNICEASTAHCQIDMYIYIIDWVVHFHENPT